MLITLLDLYSLVLLASVVLSWINLSPDNPIVRVVHQLTEPVLEQVRKVVPSVGGFDLSPIVVFFALGLLKQLLIRF
jgi:YggT family protein